MKDCSEFLFTFAIGMMYLFGIIPAWKGYALIFSYHIIDVILHIIRNKIKDKYNL